MPLDSPAQPYEQPDIQNTQHGGQYGLQREFVAAVGGEIVDAEAVIADLRSMDTTMTPNQITVSSSSTAQTPESPPAALRTQAAYRSDPERRRQSLPPGVKKSSAVKPW